MTTNRARAGVIALAAFVLVVSAQPAAASPIVQSPARVADNTMTIGHLFAIDSLNPFIGFSNEAYLFYSLVYDYIFSLDEDQNYVPNIALSSSTPDGGRSWVYQIRQGVKWHDGTDLTSEDVAFTINYNIQNFWQLWAYQPYVNQVVQCRPAVEPFCGAKVTGPNQDQVTVYFQRPFSPGQAAVVVPIIQKAQWESISAVQAQYSYANANPIGTGMYKADPNIYTQWLNQQPIVLHANPNYHFGAPPVNRIVFRLFSDENSMVAALRIGEIDLALLSAAGADSVRQLIRDRVLPQVELQEGLTVIQYWIDIGITQLNHPGVNVRLNPARFDLAVREAMAHATDKAFILQQFYRGKGVEGSTLVSPVSSFWHYEPQADKFDYNLTKANQILDAAGYTNRDPITGVRRAAAAKTVTVYCSPENLANNCDPTIDIPQGTPLSFKMVTRVEAPEEGEMARYLEQTWAQIGIDLTITTEEEITMNVDVYGGEFDTYIWWWSADADPNYILSIQTNFTLNGWSDNYYDNRTYNTLYLQQLEALDMNARRQIVHQMQSVHYRGAAFIIVVYPYFHYAWWTDEYSGWGNMTAHPGRQVGAFWGKHPLFLELQATGSIGLPIDVLVVAAAGGAAGAVAAAVVAALLLARKKKRAEEFLPPMPPSQPPL